MANRPILFSAPMVRALLDGRKTQTRRVFKARHGMGEPVNLREHGAGDYSGRFNDPASWGYPFAEDGADMELCRWPELSGYRPGDRLWVKETWRAAKMWDSTKPSEIGLASRIWYEADRDNCDQHGKIRVSIFMPRWASRLTLTVTDVRVERLQDISEVDALAEGVERHDWQDRTTYGIGGFTGSLSPIAPYQFLWDSINGLGAWEANPWIVAVSFDVLRGNIDNVNPPP